MLLRFRRSTLPAASVVTPFRTINVNWRRRAKRSSMSWFISSSLGMCELSKKGTLCGETLGPEKGSATLENIDCAMGLRSTREYGTATSAAKSEHQAEIYADYTYTGYMRMQMLRYVYQRISWYHLATDDRGRADLVLKVPSVRRTARRDIVLRLIHHPTQHSGVTVRSVQKAELRAINRGVTRPR